MRVLRRLRSILFLTSFTLFSYISQAQQYYDLIGLTALQTTTTNINGTGIQVGQVEDSGTNVPPDFEVNPSAVGQPTNLFTYLSADGTATNYSNVVGMESGHADTVASYFYGLPLGMATNILHVDNYDANYYITNFVANLQPSENDLIVNQSFTYGYLNATDQEQVDSAYDDYSEAYGILFVSAADNIDISTTVSAPGTAYNCISVGDYISPSSYGNSIGPTIDNGRCKPDITAPASKTSFSTPQVAGAAADLMQAALRGDGGSDTNSAFDSRTVKALLLNGAIKPLGWTNSSLFPLDARYGSGVLNVFNSYRQLAGGKHSANVTQLVASGSTHPPTGSASTEPVLTGWDFATNTSSQLPFAQDAVSHYYFNVSNNIPGAAFTASATLVWNRQQGQSGINNLNLFLYNCANSNLVACSTSLVNNVEHIYQTNLTQGRYDLQVWKAGALDIVSAAEPSALAYTFYSDTLSLATKGTNLTLNWPAYPQGFMVQYATNLASPVWTNTALPQPVITNNMNSLPLSATNAAQFFRLFSPDQ